MAPEPGILEVPDGADVHEFLIELGLSDGLPVVPPTAARVRWMLSATPRRPEETIGVVPPSLSPLSVHQAATNAVMAGCTPAQFPLVLAGAEAMIDPKFGLHGVHATTMGATIAVIVNGPARLTAELNSGLGALGSGARPNPSLGRALKLIIQNVGGAKLGGTESSTISNPCKFSYCLAENEEALGSWEPLANTLDPGSEMAESWLTVRSVVSGPEQLVDFESTDPRDLVEKMAGKMVVAYSQEVGHVNEELVIISPEHATTLQRGGVRSKRALQQLFFEATNAQFAVGVAKGVSKFLAMKNKPVLGAVIGTMLGGLSNLLNLVAPFRPAPLLTSLLHATLFYGMMQIILSPHAATLTALVVAARLSGAASVVRRRIQALVPKFTAPESFHIVVAGAPAGKFSAFSAGFGVGKRGMPSAFMSVAVTRKIAPLEAAIPPLLHESTRVLIDPRRQSAGTVVPRSPREPTVLDKGCTIGLLDISKPGGSHVLDRLEAQLHACHTNLEFKRYCKPTFSRPCPEAQGPRSRVNAAWW